LSRGCPIIDGCARGRGEVHRDVRPRITDRYEIDFVSDADERREVPALRHIAGSDDRYPDTLGSHDGQV
jgi:hypothetical protein